MSNAIDDALHNLAVELDKVLPDGRVTADPRTEDVGAAMWIEMPTIVPDRPQGARQVTIDFPVWITADGADHAQVAQLNDLVAKVWDACAQLKLCWPQSSRPVQVQSGNRAVVVTVRMLMRATGFCRPDPPGVSPIPPDPIRDPDVTEE